MPGTELFGEEERKEVMDVLSTGALFRYGHDDLRKGMWKTKELEAEAKKFTGASHVHAISSGTAAVSCVMAAAGLGYGDEVIVPPFTFIASIEAVLFAGALPVFAEIDENLCLSAEGIRKAVTPKTKAVLLVHMCGAAADMDAILAVCKEHNLILVEDAGQALGATYKGKHVGLFGVAGGISLDFFKLTTAGEGGLFITNSEEAYKIADCFSDHGHNHEGANRGMENHPILGLNYRLGELNAAVGVAQMRKADYIRTQNRKHHSYLQQRLSEISEITFRPVPDPSGDSGTFLNFFLPDKDTAQKVVKQFAEDGIAGANYWFLNNYHFINQWDHLKNLKAAGPLAINKLGAPQDYHNLQLPKSQEVVSRLISFGIRCTWTDEQVAALADKMIASIQKVVKNLHHA
ncbi:MAG: DegT/DnrJ/EryC1/StrS family aminotransferase [Chitinophagaceae bacterium]|nr:DegT/DnrJ/EryC1/StrS family aminotransferase [Chitinophagaceae bacterium]